MPAEQADGADRFQCTGGPNAVLAAVPHCLGASPSPSAANSDH